jgi:L-ascorbate metabolism protein UlaG (beta-lactamase superfamily)
MKRLALTVTVLFSAAVLGASVGFPQDKAKEKDKDKVGPLLLEYHGQSFYILTTGNGKRIAFDPQTIPAYWNPRPDKKRADFVCISHNHPDHIRLEAIEMAKSTKVLRGLKTASLKSDWATIDEKMDDLRIRNVGVYHDTREGFERGKNAIFVVETDGWRIVHLGDLGHQLSDRELKKIGPVDVLMIPVGGIYTLNGAEAKRVVEQIKPKEYIFPMHYGTKVFEDILPPDEFYDGIEKRRIAIADENEITLNKSPDRPRPLIVQLHYWPKDVQKEEKKKKDK